MDKEEIEVKNLESLIAYELRLFTEKTGLTIEDIYLSFKDGFYDVDLYIDNEV